MEDELIAQFLEVSGGEENVARFYLASSNWSLEDALSNFLGNQGDNENVTSDAAALGGSGGGSAASAVQTSSATGAGNFSKTSAKPKFATLNDMTQGADNEEEGQAFYAGGSERSGQQVLGPPKRKNFREQLTDMFRMAQEQGSTSTDTTPTPSTSSSINWGQGVRLGMTVSDHAVVSATPSASSAASGTKKPVVVLKLWSQGFSIDDGELRLYDDPENKEFLETVMRGEIPSELLEMGWMVNLDVEDHRQEDYKRAPRKKTFKGSGHTLGSPTPTIIADVPAIGTSDVASTSTAAANTADAEKDAKKKLKTDTAQPTTTLQIRLADGTRLAAQFNLSHTVGDIQQYIQNARPQYANVNFRLVSSFPTRELTDNTATIENAGLKNASVLQRLI